MIKLINLDASDVIHPNEDTKYDSCASHVNFWNFLSMFTCFMMKKVKQKFF